MGIDNTSQHRNHDVPDHHDGREACPENGGDGLYQPPHSRRRNKTQQIQEKIRNTPPKPRRPDRAVYVPRARRSANGNNTSSEQSPAETAKSHVSALESSNSAQTQLEDSEDSACRTKKSDKPPTTPKKSLGKKFCNVYTPPHARHSNRIDCGECEHPYSRSSSFDHNETDHVNVKAESVPSQIENSNIVPIITESDSAICVSDYRIVDNELTAGSNNCVSDYVSCYHSDSVNNIVDNVPSDLFDLCKFDNIDSGLGVSGDTADEYKGIITEDFDDSQFYSSFSTYNESNNDLMDVDAWHETNTNEINRISMAVPNIDESNVIINANDSLGYNTSKDEDVEEKEMERVSQEINRTSRRIIKQSFISNVLVISDPIPSADNVEKKIKTEVGEVADIGNSCTKLKLEAKVSVNREESDWDAVFDDSGECLDPSLLEELTATVGKVQICKTKNSYEPYQSKRQSMLSGPYDETFAHVLEVYGFPAEFKTNDLLSVFSDYKDTGFEIKWVDDNHALMVFSSSKIAVEVLASNNSMVKTRPLHEATHESRQKAKKCAEFLQPYRQRPETCTALARRLVSGALGVKLSTASQERAEERRLIHNAREKKRQAALHKEAAWDGSLTSQNGEGS